MLVGVLIALAALGWWWTLQQMRGMDNGPWTGLGTFGWFISVWVVMMAAMMFPSVAPTVALYARMSRNRLAPMVFVAGYLATWTGAGVVAFLVGVLAGHAAPDLQWDASRPGPDRSDPAGGGGIRADPVEERLPEQVPQPPRAAPRVVARRVVRGAVGWG